MLGYLKGLFKKERQTLREEMQTCYKISASEVRWAVDKIKTNKRMYEAQLVLINNGALQNWKELAALHYILFRLNYTRLKQIKPSALTNYSAHYYFEAGMEILNELNK